MAAEAAAMSACDICGAEGESCTVPAACPSFSDPSMPEVLNWARDAFGLAAFIRRERALRFLEEAIELAQAEGISMVQVDMMTTRVFGRQAGSPEKEIGQTQMTLNLLAHIAGLDTRVEQAREWQRLKLIPIDEFRRRHEVKRVAGLTAG